MKGLRLGIIVLVVWLFTASFSPLAQVPTKWVQVPTKWVQAQTSTARLLAGIQAHAFVSRALIPANHTQTLFVIVQDKNLTAVAGAMVSVSVIYPDGSRYDVRAPQTDANGISRLDFLVGKMPVKEVVRVEVEVDFQGNQTQAATWFRMWW